MGVITYQTDITSSIPPTKMFNAFILDADNLVPKILPQAIKSVEILEGDGGAGTVKLVTFGEDLIVKSFRTTRSQFKSVKHRVDGMDKDNLTYSYSIIEGDALMGVLESISYVVKIEASPEGGSICKQTSTYHTKGDVQITEEQIKGGKAKAQAMFKAVEAYLLANPDAY